MGQRTRDIYRRFLTARSTRSEAIVEIKQLLGDFRDRRDTISCWYIQLKAKEKARHSDFRDLLNAAKEVDDQLIRIVIGQFAIVTLAVFGVAVPIMVLTVKSGAEASGWDFIAAIGFIALLTLTLLVIPSLSLGSPERTPWICRILGLPEMERIEEESGHGPSQLLDMRVREAPICTAYSEPALRSAVRWLAVAHSSNRPASEPEA